MWGKRFWWITGVVTLLALLAAPGLGAPGTVQAQGGVDQAAILNLVNNGRSTAGSGIIALQSQLNSAAQQHSDYLAGIGEGISHVGEGGSSPGERVTDTFYVWTAVGENVLARGDNNAQSIYNQWYASTGHRQNMLNSSFTQMGVACTEGGAGAQYGYYCTMVLARPANNGSAGVVVVTTGDGANPGSLGAITDQGAVEVIEVIPAEPTPPPLPPNPLLNWEGNPQAPGFDGRLNPDAAEYYTVGCENDVIGVYNAGGALLNSVPIGLVLGMDPAGATMDLGANMTVARNGTSVTIGGYNGNSAPAFGTKEFTIDECLARNGRTPTAVNPASIGLTVNTLRPSGQQPNAAPVQPVVPVQPAAANCVHVVQRGQTAFSIARTYGASLNAIAAANGGVNLTRIYPGQQLIIPGCSAPLAVAPTVPQTTTTTTTTTQAPTAAPTAAPTGTQTHTVQRGENVFRIALRYGTTVEAIAAANALSDVRRIQVGQVLVIP